LLENAGVSVGLTRDYIGTTVGSLPDIGAYEFTLDAGFRRALKSLRIIPGFRKWVE
jgi:hypothetical protein